MMKSCVCVLCVLFSVLAVDAQNNAAALRVSGLKAYRDGHYAEAESLLRSALQQVRGDKAARAQLYSDLCSLLLDEENMAEAERACTNALEGYRSTGDKPGVALVLRHLGATYSLQRRNDEAMSTLKQALKTAESDQRIKPAIVAAILNSLGMAYFRTDNLGKAEKMFEEAFKVSAVLPDLGETPEILNNLGATAYRQKKFERAETLLQESIRRTETQLGPNHPRLTYTLSGLAKVYTDMGRFAAAQALYGRCLSILEHSEGDFSVRIAVTLRALSDVYLQTGKTEQAGVVLQGASDIARRHLSHADMPDILEAHARFLLATGKQEAARNLRAEARRARVALENTVRAYSANEKGSR